MELILRLRRYTEYPFALCLLSRKYVPVGLRSNVHVFLNTPPEQLDVGCGLQINTRAWEAGSESRATTWLLSDPAQAMIDRLVQILLATSLEVERRHAQIKKWETSKVTHIATASRNAIAMRFLRWRKLQCDLLASAERDVKKITRTNLHALAWKQPAAARPVGVRFAVARQPDIIAATGGSSSSAASAVPVASEPAAAAEKYDLQSEKDKLLLQARQALDRFLDKFLLPVTRQQWERWLDGCL